MNEDQLNQIKETIANSIDKNVNGKINLLTQKFDDYVLEDMTWKKKYEPFLEGLASISVAGKIVLWIAVAVTSIGSALVFIKSYFIK